MPSATLTAWVYDTPMGASAAEVRLKDLEQQGGLTVLDAITLTWVPGDDEPRVGHLRRKTGSAAAKGSVLGTLAGTLVLAPVAGAAAGAGIGALVQRLKGAGIEEHFVTDVRDRLRPGTSAMLVLSRDVDLELIRPFIQRGRERGDVTLLRAELRDDAPGDLGELLGELETPPSP